MMDESSSHQWAIINMMDYWKFFPNARELEIVEEQDKKEQAAFDCQIKLLNHGYYLENSTKEMNSLPFCPPVVCLLLPEFPCFP